MKGDTTPNSLGTFGTQGIPNSANTPPALYEAANWTDHQGNFWLFGGYNYYPSQLYNSALWKFDPATNDWTWVKGPSSPNQSGVYGTQGIPDINNYPGARSFGSASWVDSSGALWLFGGSGYDANGATGKLNDLWRYDISSNEWTWMKGNNTCCSNGNYGTIGVEAATNEVSSRTEACGTWTGYGNYLYLFGGVDNSWNNKNDLWRYNVSTNNWIWIKGSSGNNSSPNYGVMGIEDPGNDPGARYVYSRWLDCDGNLIFFGGWTVSSLHWNDVWKFDIATNEWVWLHGPSTTNDAGTSNNYCEFDSSFNPHSRSESKACWRDAYGKLWLFGGFFMTEIYNDLWVYDPTINQWSFVNGSTTANQDGFFGQQQVYNPSNIPQSKDGSASWIDSAGNFWIFGGYHSYSAQQKSTNDLWRYVPDYSCIGTNSCLPSSIIFFANDTSLCEKFCINFTDQSINNPTSWQWQFPGGDPSSSIDQNPTNICYNSPGTYDVTLITTNANGIDTLTLPNYITVYTTPPFPTITQVGYTLTSSPATSYQWQINSADIPGATNQSYTILQTGYYTVIVGDSNGCVNSFTVYILISGIDEVSGDANVSIYPNPSSGNFIVEWLNGLASGEMVGEVSIQVVNTLGQKIYSSSQKISAADKKMEIDLRDAVPGIYFIEIKTQNEFVRKKILIAD